MSRRIGTEAEAYRRDYARKRACEDAARLLRETAEHFAETHRARREIIETARVLEDEVAHVVAVWD